MKNKEFWEPSKYILQKNGQLGASTDKKKVGPGSWLMIDAIARFYSQELPLHLNGKLLDLGCGMVPLYTFYKSLIEDNVCVDWSNTLHKNPYLDFEVDLNGDLPFSDASFDCIILSDVLEHIRFPDHLWAEMSRVLKPQGKIILNVPFYYWLHEEPYDYFRYTRHALASMAVTNGMQVITLESLGGVPEVLTDIHSKLFSRIPVIGPAFAMGLQKTVRFLIQHTIVKRLSDKTKNSFPLGYFMVAQKKEAAVPDTDI